jgi:mevalonate kinase
MSEGYGYGKVILFGEHFVVYNIPGIASGISDSTVAILEDGKEGFELFDNRPQVPGYGEKKLKEMTRQFEAIFNYFNYDPEENPIKITLKGDLLCSSGVGASAALAASVSRALNEKLSRGMNNDEINKVAYLAEEAGSGTPSGIDNTCSVYGGFITFEKNPDGGPNKIERLETEEPMEIVMASTGITQETKIVVDDVRAKKEANENWFNGIVEKYKNLYERALQSIKGGDWRTIGSLMDDNQQLLREIDVSCDELENLIKIAKDNGAWGAKLTGTGRGGYVVALTPGKELQEKVASAIESQGFKVLKTTIG